MRPPQTALVAASVLAGLAYPFAWDRGFDPAALIALKGTGVGCLALAAVLAARSRDACLLAAVMVFGALGDVLLDIRFEAGVAAFGIGHAIAIALYLRNRRTDPSRSQQALAAALLLFGLVSPALLLGSGDPRLVPLTIYSAMLSAMAATAWLSRFPRSRTGLGAILFVASDALIAARMGPLAGAAWASLAIWLLYYVGQLLIFLGVRSRLD